MKHLSDTDEIIALKYLDKAIILAEKATCKRSKCGSVIVKSGKIIGGGFNSPPKDYKEQERCSCSKDLYHKKVTDKTCCVHAEQRAIMDALKKNPDKLPGSRLYFIRIDKDGVPSDAGEPYCTICSKMALDVGISEFVLRHNKRLCVYETKEYNTLSFQYGSNNKETKKYKDGLKLELE